MRSLLEEAARLGASDVFACAGKKPRIKRGGRLETLDAPESSDAQLDAFRRRVLLPAAEESYQQSGAVDAGLTLAPGVRFRVNFHSQQGRPALVARRVPSGAMELASLGLPPLLGEIASAPRGLVVVCGAAGSGKSTTLAAMVHHINATASRHIVTIEDPIEFIHQDIHSLVTQREIGADAADFAEALKNVVRQSPDVIMLGEIRDADTMQTVLAAALTGHLVLTTLHTATVVQSVERIVNHFPEHLRQQVAGDLAICLEAVLAQRLVPAASGSGLIPVVEILRMTPRARVLVAARQFGDLEDLIRMGREEGMRTFSRALADLYKAGAVSMEAAAAAATNRDEFLFLAHGMESGVETFRQEIAPDPLDDSRVNMEWLLHSAIAHGASDLVATAGSPPCLRIDGRLSMLATDPLTPVDCKRLLFSLLNTKQRELFEERREIDFAISVAVRPVGAPPSAAGLRPRRFRVNGFHQRGTPALAVRVVPDAIPKADDLMLPQALCRISEKTQGLILVTGPTGHGKSTTLACLIDRINRTRPCHIITVEDPIEYVHENKAAIVEQREVHADTLSFANALKYVLRQDPDVILVGEMRDVETIAAALTAAETGHLVLATLHTNDAAQSIDRIVDSFPAHQQNQIRMQLAGCILGIVAQRLIPRRGGGGRVAAFEVLIGIPAIRALIRDGKTHLIPSTIELNSKEGMVTMDKSIRELFARNLISRQDALAYMLNSETLDGFPAKPSPHAH